MRKMFLLALGCVTAIGSLLGPAALGATAASAMSKAAAPASGHSRPGAIALHYRTVPLSSIPAAARAALAAIRPHATVRPNDSVTIVEFVNVQYDMCLDANNFGATAGGDGDTVQLYGCFGDAVGHQNQWWIPAQSTNGYTELVNLQYPKCLDADDSRGLVDGAKVQLWNCFNDSVGHSNQWWNFSLNSTGTLSVLWGGGVKVLDANDFGPSAGQNGDKIQIWRYLGGDNQFWYE